MIKIIINNNQQVLFLVKFILHTWIMIYHWGNNFEIFIKFHSVYIILLPQLQQMALTFLYILLALIQIINSQFMYSSSAGSFIITQPLSTPILSSSSNFTSPTLCGKMQIRNNHLYHLNAQQTVQILAKSISQTIIGTVQYSYIDNNTITSIFVNQQDNQLILIASQISNPHYIRFNVNRDGIASFIQNVYDNPSQIFSCGSNLYKYYKNILGDRIAIYDRNQNLIVDKNLSHSNASLFRSNSLFYAAAVTQFSQIFIYNLTDFAIIGIYNDSITNQSFTTNCIIFNKQDTLFMVETDNFLNVFVVNISNFVNIKTGLFNFTIIGGAFMNDKYVMIFGVGQTWIWQYFPPNITFAKNFKSFNNQFQLLAQTYQYDYSRGQLYTCYNNTISHYYIDKQIPIETDPVNSNNSNGTNLSNNNLYYTTVIEMNQNQRILYTNLEAITDSSTKYIFQKIITIAMATPFTFYFLNFINFISFSTLYVLINDTIPNEIFTILSKVYLDINENILQVLGTDTDISALTQQRVNNNRALYLGVSSDLVSYNYFTVCSIIVNLIISQLMHLVGTRFQKGKCLRRIFIQNRYQVFCGQIVSLILSLAIGWKYSIFGGVHSFKNAINSIFQYILFFLSSVFPILYLLLLIMSQRRQIIAYRKKTVNIIKTMKTMINHKMEQIGLRSLLNGQILQEWYICTSNFAYPFFISFRQSQIFLSALLLYCLLGVVIAAKSSKWNVNAVILSLYPLIYHCCFIALYFSQNDSTQANIGIVVLIILLMGSFHNLITIFENTARALCKIKNQSKQSSIQPEIQPLQKYIIKTTEEQKIVFEKKQTRKKYIKPTYKYTIKYQQQEKIMNSPCFNHVKSVRNKKFRVKTQFGANNERIVMKSAKSKCRPIIKIS